MLEKSIKRFKENVFEIEQAISQDVQASKLQALDESLRQTFLEIKHFDTDSDDLRQIQIQFFLDYICDLSENDLVVSLVKTTKGLVEHCGGTRDQPSSIPLEGMCSMTKKRDTTQ